MKTRREVVQDWVTAYNRRDDYAAAELYHEDAANLQVALGDPTVGRQAMLDELLSFFHAFPDDFTDIENLFEDGQWAMLEWFGGGTWRGEFGGMAPNKIFHVARVRLLPRSRRQDPVPAWIF